MNNTLRRLPATLLACLGLLCAPAHSTAADATADPPTNTAANSPGQVQIGANGIHISEGSRQVVVGSTGIHITDGSQSFNTNVPVVTIPPVPSVNTHVPSIDIQIHGVPNNPDDCRGGKEIVAVGHDAVLPAGQNACDVVAIFGNAEVHGNVSDSVVSVFGNSAVDGSVANSAVAVLGSMNLDGTVGQSAVAILGNLSLGPHAVINGQVVNIMGATTHAPTAVIQGGIVNVLSGFSEVLPGLSTWAAHCLIFGRPLAPRLDIGWAWAVALAALAFYLLLAALLHEALGRCVRTLEDHPGPSILAAFALVALTPVLMLVLVMTVIGIAVIPLLWFALFCAGIFGRVVSLAWLGGRLLRTAPTGVAQPVLHVLVGGVVVILLYMVPMLGFIVWAAVGLLGFGAIGYTLLLALRNARSVPPAPQAAAFGAATAPGVEPASTASEQSFTPNMEAGTTIPGGPPAGGAGAAPLDLTMLPRAGFWIRMAALLIDVVLVGFVLGMIGHQGSHGMLLVLAAYGAIMWKLNGSTVGGIICNLKVARLDGRPIGWESAILRALGCFLSLVIAGIGFFWIAFDREHQAWHDKIAGTVVVLVPKSRGLV